ncbi:DNA/RNA non-specific endonuclease [Tsukamurella sp. DT100]|uniref:DNA/RNA non-specific endonuclease n=1 Tax=Tsukamurella sp. DT100 TaxID=3393415 RepID=UPI003CF36911
MSFDITPGDGIVGELELLGDLIVGGFPEAVFTLPGVSVDEVLDHARLYLGFAEAAQAAHSRVRGLEIPEFVGVEGEFFRGRVPGELAMQLGAAVESYSRVGSGIKELARELDASQAALKPLEARARAVFEHMQKVWIKVNVPFTEYSGLRSEWDELVRAAGVVHERVAVAGQQAAAAITAGTEAMVPVNDYFSTLPGGAVAGGVVAQGVRSTASRAVTAAGGVTGAPGRAVKAIADGLGVAAGAVTSVPQQITVRGQQLAYHAAELTSYGPRVGDQLITDPRSEAAQRLVREGRATNILGLDPTGVPTAMLMLASPNTLIREQEPKKRNAGRRWTTASGAGQSRIADTTAVPAASSVVVAERRRSALSTVFTGAAGAAGSVRDRAGAVREGSAGVARNSRGVWIVGEQIAQAAQRVTQVAGNVEQLAALTSWAATQTAAGQLPHAAAKVADATVGQLVSVPGRFISGYASIVTDGISGTAALLGVGGDPVRAWSGLAWNVLNPVKGASRFAVAASPLEAAADPVYAAGAAALWGTNAAIAAVPFAWVVTLPLTFTLGTAQTLLRPGLLSRIEAKKTLDQSLDATTEQHLQDTAARATANTSQVQVTTSDVDVHALDHGGYVTFTLPDLEGGEPKAWYILATPDSPGNFTTNVPTAPDQELVERADGSVVLVNTATGQIVRTIKTPWAKDALGRDQPTWYSIDKVDDVTSTITQHIAPNKNALYPLVADPVSVTSGGEMTSGNTPPVDSKDNQTPSNLPAASAGPSSGSASGSGPSRGSSSNPPPARTAPVAPPPPPPPPPPADPSSPGDDRSQGDIGVREDPGTGTDSGTGAGGGFGGARIDNGSGVFDGGAHIDDGSGPITPPSGGYGIGGSGGGVGTGSGSFLPDQDKNKPGWGFIDGVYRGQDPQYADGVYRPGEGRPDMQQVVFPLIAAAIAAVTVVDVVIVGSVVVVATSLLVLAQNPEARHSFAAFEKDVRDRIGAAWDTSSSAFRGWYERNVATKVIEGQAVPAPGAGTPKPPTAPAPAAPAQPGGQPPATAPAPPVPPAASAPFVTAPARPNTPAPPQIGTPTRPGVGAPTAPATPARPSTPAPAAPDTPDRDTPDSPDRVTPDEPDDTPTKPGGLPAGIPAGIPGAIPDTSPGGTPNGDRAGPPGNDPNQVPGGVPGGHPAGTPTPDEQTPPPDKDKDKGTPVRPIPAPSTNPNTVPNPDQPGESIRIPGHNNPLETGSTPPSETTSPTEPQPSETYKPFTTTPGKPGLDITASTGDGGDGTPGDSGGGNADVDVAGDGDGEDDRSGAPGPLNGYPLPKTLVGDPKYPNVVSDIVDAHGNRTVTWADGGYVTYKALNGRAATGIEALVTKDMVKQGTAAKRTVLPPGWDPAKAWTKGELQRGHAHAAQLGGMGDDGRNIFTITETANKRMRQHEDDVREIVDFEIPVKYSVTPIYGNGEDSAPTSIEVTARGGGLDIDDPIENIP